MALNEEEEKLEQLKQKKRFYEDRAKELLSGTLNVQEIESNKNAILVMDNFVAEQYAQVDAARMRVESAREKMAVAMQERKTQEILRDRAFEEFLREENRAESNAPHEANFLKLDCTKLKTVFGWRPRWHMEETMRMICRWTEVYFAGGDIPAEMDSDKLFRQLYRYLSIPQSPLLSHIL
mgnify:CR=1 FL=1